MNNKYDKLSFFAYINNHMSRETISFMYSANNIRYEKCVLYGDFVQSLLMTIFDTYLGDDVTSIDEQFKHFQWCWETTIDKFEDEGIVIDNPKLYDYFLEFMIEVFYTNKEKTPSDFTDKSLLRIWNNIFDFSRPKTNSDIDAMIEIYAIFEKALKTQ